MTVTNHNGSYSWYRIKQKNNSLALFKVKTRNRNQQLQTDSFADKLSEGFDFFIACHHTENRKCDSIVCT